MWLRAVSVAWPHGDGRAGCGSQVAPRAFPCISLGSEMCTSSWLSLPRSLGASALDDKGEMNRHLEAPRARLPGRKAKLLTDWRQNSDPLNTLLGANGCSPAWAEQPCSGSRTFADLSLDHGTASATVAVLLHLAAALGHGQTSPGSALC